ncbi:hypothetical protein Ancab_033189, partial [Ancistrocladus abbreviatus]
MAQKLNQIWIGSFKLAINVAKFGKKAGANYKSVSSPKTAPSKYGPTGLRGMSYVDVVRSPPRANYLSNQEHGESKQQQVHLCVEVNSYESELSWLRGSFTGILKSINTLLDLGKKVKEAGIRNCLTRPIGGNLILLTTTGVESIEEIARKNRSIFEE